MQEYQLGDTIGGRYKLLEVLGEGGMGKVYKALDIKLEQEVAFKTLKPGVEGSETIQRMIREAKGLARFRTNPNILTIYDFYEDSNVLGIITEFVDGITLGTLFKQQKTIYPHIFLMIIREICDALERPHAEGFIHRDLKPANVMIDRAGRIILMDFGLIKQLGNSDLTEANQVLGTPAYISPETLKQEPVGPYSDIFAIGIMLYEIVLGCHPFRLPNSTVYELLNNIMNSQFRKPSEVHPDIDPELEQIMVKCLERNSQDRFSDAGLVKGVLDRYLAKYGLHHPKDEIHLFVQSSPEYIANFTKRLNDLAEAWQAENRESDVLSIRSVIARFAPIPANGETMTLGSEAGAIPLFPAPSAQAAPHSSTPSGPPDEVKSGGNQAALKSASHGETMATPAAAVKPQPATTKRPLWLIAMVVGLGLIGLLGKFFLFSPSAPLDQNSLMEPQAKPIPAAPPLEKVATPTAPAEKEIEPKASEMPVLQPPAAPPEAALEAIGVKDAATPLAEKAAGSSVMPEKADPPVVQLEKSPSPAEKNTPATASSSPETPLAPPSDNAQPVALRKASRPGECPAGMVKIATKERRIGQFCLDKHEFSVKNCRDLKTNCQLPAAPQKNDPIDLPIRLVTFEEARQYCQVQGLELPSVTYWQASARGLSNSLARFNVLSRLHRTAKLLTIHELSRDQSAFGVQGLGGNVREWAIAEDGQAAICGQGFDNEVENATTLARCEKSRDPKGANRQKNVGFRCMQKLIP
jgi:serine/threonine-protein kinase